MRIEAVKPPLLVGGESEGAVDPDRARAPATGFEQALGKLVDATSVRAWEPGPSDTRPFASFLSTPPSNTPRTQVCPPEENANPRPLVSSASTAGAGA